MANNIFFVVNSILTVCYVLLAFFFASRVKLPRGGWRKGWRTIVTLLFASALYIGAANTHLILSILSYQEGLNPYWLIWYNVVSLTIQMVGGIGFFALASRWVHLRICDRKDFYEIVGDDPKRNGNGKHKPL